MDDNIWEYPFGDIDDDEDMFFCKPGLAAQGSPVPAGHGRAERPSSGCSLF
jgi:hypothetical protein